jgi:hypothetical protein
MKWFRFNKEISKILIGISSIFSIIYYINIIHISYPSKWSINESLRILIYDSIFIYSISILMIHIDIIDLSQMKLLRWLLMIRTLNERYPGKSWLNISNMDFNGYLSSIQVISLYIIHLYYFLMNKNNILLFHYHILISKSIQNSSFNIVITSI